MIVKFWLVWRENGGVPLHQHPSFESARREAGRLAEQCPGEVFHVLESAGACIKRTVDWLDAVDVKPTDETDPPF